MGEKELGRAFTQSHWQPRACPRMSPRAVPRAWMVKALSAAPILQKLQDGSKISLHPTSYHIYIDAEAGEECEGGAGQVPLLLVLEGCHVHHTLN